MRNHRSAGIVPAARESPRSHSISHRIDHNKGQFLSRPGGFLNSVKKNV